MIAAGPVRPPEFEGWVIELGEIADEEGLDLFWFAWLYAPVECCEFLAAQPGARETLIARARWADVCAGRRDLRRRVS